MPRQEFVNPIGELVGEEDPGAPAPPFRSSLLAEVEPGYLYRLRSTVSAYATSWGLGQDRLGHLLLVATELATNALRHGGGEGTLRLWCDGDAIYCQVIDGGPGITDPHLAGTHLPPAPEDKGRGLWLVRQFSDHLHIVNGTVGAKVTACFNLWRHLRGSGGDRES